MRILERTLRKLDQRAVQRLFEAVVLTTDPSPLGHVLRDGEHWCQVDALCLPVRDAAVGVEHLGVADGLVDAAEPELGQIAPDVFGDEAEEVLDELRLTV